MSLSPSTSSMFLSNVGTQKYTPSLLSLTSENFHEQTKKEHPHNQRNKRKIP
uniref:Uncharacterized protein n=1 Tax=Rhizophora mucronata TaxID=61149 RepID=A0A2P2NSB5_RHIMU